MVGDWSRGLPMTQRSSIACLTTSSQRSNMSPLALKTIKRVLTASYDTSLNVGLEVEGHAYEKLRDSRDYKEGIAAFTEKRKANFTGN